MGLFGLGRCPIHGCKYVLDTDGLEYYKYCPQCSRENKRKRESEEREEELEDKNRELEERIRKLEESKKE